MNNNILDSEFDIRFNQLKSLYKNIFNLDLIKIFKKNSNFNIINKVKNKYNNHTKNIEDINEYLDPLENKIYIIIKDYNKKIFKNQILKIFPLGFYVDIDDYNKNVKKDLYNKIDKALFEYYKKKYWDKISENKMEEIALKYKNYMNRYN